LGLPKIKGEGRGVTTSSGLKRKVWGGDKQGNLPPSLRMGGKGYCPATLKALSLKTSEKPKKEGPEELEKKKKAGKKRSNQMPTESFNEEMRVGVSGGVGGKNGEIK